MLVPNPINGSSSSEISTVRNGFKLLGSPIGNVHYRSTFLSEHLLKTTELLNYIDPIRYSYGFNIMNYCINTVPVFLRRAVDLENSSTLFGAFDEAIDRQIFKFMEKNYDAESQSLKDRVRKIRFLPRKQGGLGLMEHSSGVGDKNLWAARIAMEQFLSKHYPDMLSSHQREYHQLSLETYINNGEQTLDLKAALQKYYDFQENSVYEQLQINPQDKWFSAVFRSNHFRGNGKWLDIQPFHLKRYVLDNLPFVCNMRTCFGYDPITNDMIGGASSNITAVRSPISYQCCLCDNMENATNVPATDRNALHSYDCDKTKGLVKQRHDAIRDSTICLIRKAHPRALV